MALTKKEQAELNELSMLAGRSSTQKRRMDALIKKRGPNNPRKTSLKPAQQGPGFGLREAEARALEPTPGLAPRLAPIDPSDRNQVIWRQTELRNLGVDIEVDGIWGPKTQWFEAMVNNGDWTPSPASAPSPSAPSGVRTPPASVPPTSINVAPAAVSQAPPRVLGPEWEQQVRDQFPAFAGLLEIPEIGDVLRQAYVESWPAEKITARLANTQWYKTTPQKTRDWIGFRGSDPASAQRLIEEGAAGAREIVDQYKVDLSDDALRQWSEDILSGKAGTDTFRRELLTLAKSKYPGLAAQLDAGQTVVQAASAYVGLAAKELEIPEESIDIGDPKWSRALDHRDANGNPTVMTLYDWQKVIRTDEVYGWDRTSGARQQAANFVTQLHQTFGKAG